MRVSNQAISFLLTYFLLSACLCAHPHHSHRQKRGIMKMMMHIMWDPVRLIRYWYAYDVTKEIAKSWRKIIPTILFLPITQHMPLSYGLAKYVHPTIGFRDTPKHKTKSKHYNAPRGSYFQESSITKPGAIPPEILHEVLPSRYSYFPQKTVPQYFISSRETENSPQYEQKNVPQVIVEHIPYEDKENGNQYSVAHYFVGEGNSKEQGSASSSEIIFPALINHNSDDNIRLSSSQSVQNNFKSRPSNTFLRGKQQKNVHFGLPHTGTHEYRPQEEKDQETAHILHPGQEFHIVLHPIPVSDFDTDNLRPPSEGQTIKFVPIHPLVNESHAANSNPLPLLLKAVLQSSVESISTDQRSAGDASHNDNSTKIRLHNVGNGNSTSKEKLSSSQESSKPAVTWISQDPNLSGRKDIKEIDMQPDETIRRISSVHKDPSQKLLKDNSMENDSKMQSFVFNRQNINIERLREDLKHGTPVLIPFNKNIYSSSSSSVSDTKEQAVLSQIPNKHIKQNYLKEATSSSQAVPADVQNGPYSSINSSIEYSGERNSTQRFVLFLKKRKHS